MCQSGTLFFCKICTIYDCNTFRKFLHLPPTYIIYCVLWMNIVIHRGFLTYNRWLIMVGNISQLLTNNIMHCKFQSHCLILEFLIFHCMNFIYTGSNITYPHSTVLSSPLSTLCQRHYHSSFQNQMFILVTSLFLFFLCSFNIFTVQPFILHLGLLFHFHVHTL